MAGASRHDAWQAGDSYEIYMGRWSRQIAPRFIEWLEPDDDLDWLEVGCGTGALSARILSDTNPKSLISVDPSEGFLEKARSTIADPRVEFQIGDGEALSIPSGTRDIVVSGLVLNFIPDREKALQEMQRAARSKATIAFYVWDYPGGGVEFMRAFWTAATALDPSARDLTEDRRFPFCTLEGLADLAHRAGLSHVETTKIEAPTRFQNFDDFWHPFTLGAGPAPGYCANLKTAEREKLREKLEESLPTAEDGSIPLRVRAWAIRGRKQ
jgi:SAM-dependent methyltransferase|nr:class I SAM-dependent methyltransferase [Neorhizobium tomejilense]